MRRSFQISRARINVMVEGREVDGYLYDKICHAELDATGVRFRVVRGDELAGGPAGGKAILLQFFDYLKRNAALERTGSYSTLFCLDKDVDDLDRTRRRSPHVLYTPSYDIENLLVTNADLQDCAAAVMSMPTGAFSHLTPTLMWCRAVQLTWMSWVALCLCARSFRVPRANYNSRSQVNDPLHGPPDAGRVAAVLADIAASAGVPPSTVQTRYSTRVRMVTRSIRNGRGDEFFKGKWYLDVLSSELAGLGGRTPGVIRASLQATLLQQADALAPCFDFVRQALVTRSASV